MKLYWYWSFNPQKTRHLSDAVGRVWFNDFALPRAACEFVTD